MSCPKLAVACAPVTRSRANREYNPDDYEVFLLHERDKGFCMFPHAHIGCDREPLRAALEEMEKQSNMKGYKGYALLAKGSRQDNEEIVTIFYAIPVGVNTSPLPQASFQRLSSVLENKDGHYCMHPVHREMAFALDQWLRERHTIPFVNLDILFLCNNEEKGIGGLVKAIIDNPIYENHIRSPEDELIIGINNPLHVFEAMPILNE